MAAPLQDVTALVTGASSGVGRELARQLAPRARALVLVARREERLLALREELVATWPALRVHVSPCDLADMAAVDAMLADAEEAVGTIDILVNDAALGEQQLYWEADWERVEQIVRVNTLAVLRLTRRLLPGMVAHGRGGILNVGSGAGFSPMPGAATYVGTKHFLRGFSDTLRLELEGTGVTVTHVAPGPMPTEFAEAAGIRPSRSGSWPALVVTAEQCAREALRGFERGQAVVYPGGLYRLLMRLAQVAPQWVIDASARGMAREMRQLSGASPPPDKADPGAGNR